MDGLTKPDDTPGEAKPAESAADEIIVPAANDQAPFVRLDPGTPPGPGAVLRAERESRGYSIDDVATALKLAPRQVEAIEADDFDALRGQTFARGFVKNYARLLQLDPDPLVARIKSSAPPVQVSIEPRSNTHTEVPLAGGSQGPVVAGGLAVLALMVVAVVGTSGDWLGGDPKSRDKQGMQGEGGVVLSQTSAMAPPLHSPLSASAPPAAASPVAPAEGYSADVVAASSASSVGAVVAPAVNTSAITPGASSAAPAPASALATASAGKPAVTNPPAGVSPAAPGGTVTPANVSVPGGIAATAPKPLQAAPAAQAGTAPVQPAGPVVAATPPASLAVATTPGKPAVNGASAMAATTQGASATAASLATKPAVPRTSGTVMSFTTPKPATATPPASADTAPRTGELTMTTAPTPPKARGDKRMVLSFEQEAWVEVRDGDGKVVFSQLSPAGANRVVEGKGPLNFVVGNAHHVKLKVDDKPFDLKPHIGVTVARFSVQ